MTNKIIIKIIFILILFMLIAMNCSCNNIYAVSAEEELIGLLNEYRDYLGDLKEFGQVFGNMANEIENASQVDDNLKQKLTNEIEKLRSVKDINPLIANTFEVEFKSQIQTLDNSNIEDFYYEMELMEMWVNNELGIEEEEEDSSGEEIEDEEEEVEEEEVIVPTVPNQNLSTSILPKAGKAMPIIVLIIGIILANLIYAIKKYKFYKKLKV